MAEWLKGCEACNVGIIAHVDEGKATGKSEKKIFKEMSEQSDSFYSPGAIRLRYKRIKGGGAPSPPKKKQNPTAQPVKEKPKIEPPPDSARSKEIAAKSSPRPSELEQDSETGDELINNSGAHPNEVWSPVIDKLDTAIEHITKNCCPIRPPDPYPSGLFAIRRRIWRRIQIIINSLPKEGNQSDIEPIKTVDITYDAWTADGNEH